MLPKDIEFLKPQGNIEYFTRSLSIVDTRSCGATKDLLWFLYLSFSFANFSHSPYLFRNFNTSFLNMAAPSKKVVLAALLLNICFSILIVLTNKWIYTHYGFPNLTMNCIHFVFTTLGLLICQKLNIFQPKSLPIRQMIPLSLTFGGFVVFTNLSLQENTVGTYQLAKYMTTPCIMLIQTYFYGRKFSTKVKITVVCHNNNNNYNK